MARHQLFERRFEVEMPDGSVLYGYPLTIAMERQFLREGVWNTISSPEKHSADKVVSACITVIASVLRKDAAFVEDNFTVPQASELLKVILLESRPPIEDPKAASL